MQIKTFSYERGRDPHWLNSSLQTQLTGDPIQSLADTDWAPIGPPNDPAPLPAEKTPALPALIAGLTLLLEASRPSRPMPFPPEVSPPAFPAISEASGSMLQLVAVAVMLLLIGLAYLVERICHSRPNWKPSARVPHAPAHPPPNRASA